MLSSISHICSILLILIYIIPSPAHGLSHAKCKNSAIEILREDHITSHSYTNVNLPRSSYVISIGSTKPTFGERDDYEILSLVASGGFAKVFKAKHKPSKEIVALKIFVHFTQPVIFKEVSIIKELEQAPNFLPLKDALQDKSGMIALIFDYFEMTDYKYQFYNTTEQEIKLAFYETLRTLEYAHSRGIMHRDIKPQNVLINVEKKQVKIIDWGHGAYYLPGNEYDVKVASMPYKGPELLLKYSLHDYSLDVWSTGCLFGALLFRKMPFFRGEDLISQLDAIAKILGTTKLLQYADKYKEWMDLSILEKIGKYKEVPFETFINASNEHLVTPLAIDLLKKMLVYDHSKRITVKEALDHPYFKEYH